MIIIIAAIALTAAIVLVSTRKPEPRRIPVEARRSPPKERR